MSDLDKIYLALAILGFVVLVFLTVAMWLIANNLREIRFSLSGSSRALSHIGEKIGLIEQAYYAERRERMTELERKAAKRAAKESISADRIEAGAITANKLIPNLVALKKKGKRRG